MRAIASTFADLGDLHAFEKAKQAGMSDAQAFKYGDNGIGCWGDQTAQMQTAMCAVTPEDMLDKWGSIAEAKHKKILITYHGKSVIAILADTMPHKSHIKNGAGIDLNPACVAALELPNGGMVPVEWSWL
jgi:hypothetical protein